MGGLFAFKNVEEESRSSQLIPERELLLAILDRCVLDYHGSSEKLKLAAQEWLFEEEPGDLKKEFSFSWICQFLDISKERLRECINSLDLSDKAPQGHRWLRSKIKSTTTAQAA